VPGRYRVTLVAMRPAAEILVRESTALRLVLDEADPRSFDLPTVCTGWSVRDVLAHCGAALTRTASGNLHRFTPEDNQRDVDARKSWPVEDVIEELYEGYEAAAAAIDAAADGRLDGIGIGEWMHGGDVREALGAADAYASPGASLAVDVLIERSRRLERPAVAVTVDGEAQSFGVDGEPVGRLTTDIETFIRLCGGRRPDETRYDLAGVADTDLLLFS